MKLSKRVTIGKEGSKNPGKEFVSYQLKKLNEFGEGMIVDQPLIGRFKFEPRVQKDIPYVKDGKNVTFNACSAVIEVSNVDDFEDLELNEYGSATFDIPEKFIPAIESASPVNGKGVTIVLESFTDKDGKNKAFWKIDIEGSEATTQKTLPNTPATVEVPSQEKLDAFNEEYEAYVKKNGKDDNRVLFNNLYLAKYHNKEFTALKNYYDARPIKEEVPVTVNDDSEGEAIIEEEVDETTGNVKEQK